VMILPSRDGMTVIEVWSLILLSAGMVGVAAARSRLLRNRLLSKQLIASVLSLAAFLSVVSAMVSVRVSSGTGWHTAFGYPRTFYFSWQSFENSQHSTRFSLPRFLENSLVYVAVLYLIVVLYHGFVLGIKRMQDLKQIQTLKNTGAIDNDTRR
jgi:hypothetical protein